MTQVIPGKTVQAKQVGVNQVPNIISAECAESAQPKLCCKLQHVQGCRAFRALERVGDP